MNTFLALILGILPSLLLLCFIYYKDIDKEPIWRLVEGVYFGVIAALIDLSYTRYVLPLLPRLFDGVFMLRSIYHSFIETAIPEECCKLLLLWILIRRNTDFDEHMDGIVYAVCIGMGFAGMENVIYLLHNPSEIYHLSFFRDLMTVPAHYGFAVIMGFFYAIVHFCPQKYHHYRALILLLPIVVHGLFDSMVYLVAEMARVHILLKFFMTLILYVFCYRMHRYAYKKMEWLRVVNKSTESTSPVN